MSVCPLLGLLAHRKCVWAKAVFLKWGYVYPKGYSEVLQGVLERKWNLKTFVLLLLNEKTQTNGCEHAAL